VTATVRKVVAAAGWTRQHSKLPVRSIKRRSKRPTGSGGRARHPSM
jgi:hypothetical protein